MSDLAGKVAIVTGGSEGIGAAIAKGLAAADATVAIVNRSHPERAADIVAAIGAAAGRNINVNVLAPGNIATAMNAALRQDDSWRVKMRERPPSGDDFLSVDDLVGSVLFLVSDGARKMHGQVLCVDGGWTAW